MPRKLGGIRCAVVCYARLPMYLVQEFNASTVHIYKLSKPTLVSRPCQHHFIALREHLQLGIVLVQKGRNAVCQSTCIHCTIARAPNVIGRFHHNGVDLATVTWPVSFHVVAAVEIASAIGSRMVRGGHGFIAGGLSASTKASLSTYQITNTRIYLEM